MRPGGEKPAGQGPIAEAISELGFGRVELHRTELSSPTEYSEIYENTVGVLEKVRRENPEAEFVYHLSPGTPAMAATWILIAGSRYPADLIESSLQMGVRRVSLPFEILAKYRPPKELEHQVISL